MPFSQSGCQLLFHRISKLYESTSLLITTPAIPQLASPSAINHGLRYLLRSCQIAAARMPSDKISKITKMG